MRTRARRNPELASRKAEADEKQLTRLKALADERGRSVRHVYVTLLLLCVSTALTAGATTHEDLLRESPQKLPLLNVDVSLIGFYWLAPLVVALVHISLLLQLSLLAHALRRLGTATQRLRDDDERDSWREGVFPVLLSDLAGARSYPRLLISALRGGEWLSITVLPVAVLVLVQIQFLPYHSLPMTWWHRGCLLVMVVALWAFWFSAGGEARRWHLLRTALVGVPAAVVCFFVATHPGEWGEPLDEPLQIV